MTKTDHDILCACGHKRGAHFGKNHADDCSEPTGLTTFCSCKKFKEAKSMEEIEMTKARAVKKKSEGRTPTLAPYVDTIGGKTIYMNHDGKEHTVTVLSSGVIRMGEKDFTSPSSAGSAILGKDKKGKPRQIDGWKSWYFNRDGERVMLNTLRGSKSPLALNAPKPRKAKAAKANGATKPKKTRKPRAPKPKPNGATKPKKTRKPRAPKPKPNGATAAPPDVSDKDIPQNEPQAGA